MDGSVKALLKHERGVATTEYVVVAVLLAAVGILAVSRFGGTLGGGLDAGSSQIESMGGDGLDDSSSASAGEGESTTRAGADSEVALADRADREAGELDGNLLRDAPPLSMSVLIGLGVLILAIGAFFISRIMKSAKTMKPKPGAAR